MPCYLNPLLCAGLFHQLRRIKQPPILFSSASCSHQCFIADQGIQNVYLILPVPKLKITQFPCPPLTDYLSSSETVFTRILLSSIPTFLSAMLNFWAPPKHARLFQALDLCPFPNNHLTHAPTYFSHPLRFSANILPTRKHSLVLAHPHPAPPATASWREAGDFFPSDSCFFVKTIYVSVCHTKMCISGFPVIVYKYTKAHLQYLK